MEPTQRLLAYVADFEKTYIDDDWSRLEPHFSDAAVYVTTGGPPLGGRWEGRASVLRQLRESVDGLDRRFDTRKTEMLGSPKIMPDAIEFDWRGTYSVAGKPDLVFRGCERVEFEGDRISLLQDTMEEGAGDRIQQWLADHPF